MDEFGVNTYGPQAHQSGKPGAPFFNQRNLVIGLSIFVLFGTVFGVMRVFSNISAPFVQNTNTIAGDQLTNINEKLAALSQKDTDGDGINDFQELYQAGTSPYLADSDSDGINDLAEINSGTNPNCPEGQQCTGFLPAQTNTNAQQTTNSKTNTSADNENITAAAIRETLKNAGSPQYLLDATSDAELLQLYEQASGVDTTTNTNTSTTSTLDTLKDFSAQDIRDMLSSTGADATLLKDVSDQDLKDIFGQALQEQSGLFNGNTNSSNSNINTNS